MWLLLTVNIDILDVVVVVAIIVVVVIVVSIVAGSDIETMYETRHTI